VILTLPATSAYLAVLRTAAAGLAARLRFTLDEIEDLRIAVDEACALLLAAAVPDAMLTCRFTVRPDQVAVQVEVPSQRSEAFGRDSFAWTVLTALAGDVDAEAADGTLAVRLVKRRGSG
jgi:serine/threonine-protein kinase RsbW